MRKRGSRPVSLAIEVSTSIRGLLLGPGVLVLNGGYSI